MNELIRASLDDAFTVIFSKVQDVVTASPVFDFGFEFLFPLDLRWHSSRCFTWSTIILCSNMAVVPHSRLLIHIVNCGIIWILMIQFDMILDNLLESIGLIGPDLYIVPVLRLELDRLHLL